jgi:amidohydrolase
MNARDLCADLDGLMPGLEELYRDLHAHPELSMQEKRTAAEVARRLAGLGWEVTAGVGGTGVVGVLRNGDGPVVMLRADMDALPVRETTGLPYASTATAVDPEGRPVPVMHACGHDMHVTCLLGAAALFAGQRAGWRGTLVAVFQPAEETGAGARAMIDDGFPSRFPAPDVVLGQHVDPRPAGTIGTRPGTLMAAADSLTIRLFGRGSHGSQPQSGIDPVVMAAALVLRLQTIVSREIPPAETAVVTVGSIQAGSKENIIPGEAELKVNIRTFAEPVRARVLAAVERIARAEAAASGATMEPEFSPIHAFPLTRNDPAATARVTAALEDFLGGDRVREIEPKTGSEDFGLFGTAAGAPSVFWFFGGGDPGAYAAAEAAGRVAEDVPTNHSPRFAPVIQPTLTTGVQALVAAALDWLHP